MDLSSQPFLPPPAERTPTHSPSKSRSFSDPSTAPNALAPSPTFHEARHYSKEDHAVPKTPRRPDFLSRGLSLQMPHRDASPATLSQSMPSPANFSAINKDRVPLSPHLDVQNTYGSPTTSLPRHSRGLDFSRASTNLHHSTLAEQSSPDTSPIITQKGMLISGRKASVSSMVLDSPKIGFGGIGSLWGASLHQERSTVSSSVGSVNMLASESGSSDSDEDASMIGDDNEDTIFTTPQVHKLQNPNAATPFNPATASPGRVISPAAASLMKTIRRTRLHKGRSRKSSSSASGHSNMASPRATSPPPLRSIESATGSGYFNWPRATRSRNESLAMGTDGLHLSSGNDSGDEASLTAPSTPGVVRRVVTRRGNLLPKTKGFARIRAALLEESTPVDTEVRKEAETIRQVREREGSDSVELERPGASTAHSSPALLPTVLEDDNGDMPAMDTDSMTGLDNIFGTTGLPNTNSKGRGLGVNFNKHAARNSGGLDYWNRFDSTASMRTPPPPSFARHSSSDVNLDSPAINSNSDGYISGSTSALNRAASTASDTESVSTSAPAQAASGPINKFKRRREDDFDIASIKRRAVSPGMSSQNSPVLTQSPRDIGNGALWGQPPERKLNREPSMSDVTLVRSSSGGSGASSGAAAVVGAAGGKKLGLQGMVDTNDGLMNMSIE